MIQRLSLGLAAYQVAAIVTNRLPRVSHLSHRFPYALLIWGWIIALSAHFIQDMLDDAFSSQRTF